MRRELSADQQLEANKPTTAGESRSFIHHHARNTQTDDTQHAEQMWKTVNKTKIFALKNSFSEQSKYISG